MRPPSPPVRAPGAMTQRPHRYVIGMRFSSLVARRRRKALLRRVVPAASDSVLYAGHVRGAGCELFSLVCPEDLEGILAKWSRGTYSEPASWMKVKNPGYTGAR